MTSTNGKLDSGFCLSTASPFYFLKTPHAPAAATLAWVTRHQHHSPDRYLRHQRGTYSDTSQSPKVVVLLRVLSGCRTFYGFEQKDDDTCLSLHRRECFPCSICLCSRASLVDFYRYGAKVRPRILPLRAFARLLRLEPPLSAGHTKPMLELRQSAPLKASSGPVLWPSVLIQSLDFPQLFISSGLE